MIYPATYNGGGVNDATILRDVINCFNDNDPTLQGSSKLSVDYVLHQYLSKNVTRNYITNTTIHLPSKPFISLHFKAISHGK